MIRLRTVAELASERIYITVGLELAGIKEELCCVSSPTHVCELNAIGAYTYIRSVL